MISFLLKDSPSEFIYLLIRVSLQEILWDETLCVSITIDKGLSCFIFFFQLGTQMILQEFPRIQSSMGTWLWQMDTTTQRRTWRMVRNVLKLSTMHVNIFFK